MSSVKEAPAPVAAVRSQEAATCLSIATTHSTTMIESAMNGTGTQSDTPSASGSASPDGPSPTRKSVRSNKSFDTMTSVHKAITSDAFIASQKLSASSSIFASEEPEPVTCCGCVRRKGKPKPFQQTLVLLRHSERLDHIDPKGYKESEIGRQFPWDGPLTPAGVELAEKVSEELFALHKEVGFSAIACSPYLRCLETAAPVAHRLELPILMDQELAEVWEHGMPSDRMPHRSPEQLTELAGRLAFAVANPPLPEGGIKLFGKPPEKHPETLEMGHKRYLVRIESYIRLSAHTRQNFILVGHAPAVAAVLNIFERGYADIERTNYCARVIARRKVQSGSTDEHGVYADQWDVTSKDVEVSISKPEAHLIKTFENMHIDFCDETNEMVANRKERRTSTDKLFENTIKAIAVIQREEAKEAEEKSPKSAKSRKSWKSAFGAGTSKAGDDNVNKASKDDKV